MALPVGEEFLNMVKLGWQQIPSQQSPGEQLVISVGLHVSSSYICPLLDFLVEEAVSKKSKQK